MLPKLEAGGNNRNEQWANLTHNLHLIQPFSWLVELAIGQFIFPPLNSPSDWLNCQTPTIDHYLKNVSYRL